MVLLAALTALAVSCLPAKAATAAGAIDASFGERGRFYTPAGARRIADIRAITRLADGGFVFVAATDGGSTGLGKVFESGQRDTSFRPPLYHTLSRAFGVSDVAALANGDFIAVGFEVKQDPRSSVPVTDPRMMVLRLGGDGAPVRSFSLDGVALVEFPGMNASGRAVAVSRDGRVVVGGTAGGRPALVRLTGDGRLDGSFGDGGRVRTVVAGEDLPRAWTVVLEMADGRIVAVGEAQSAVTGRAVVVVARYLPDGRLDGSFGEGGVSVFVYDAESCGLDCDAAESTAKAAVLQRVATAGGVEERVVVAGRAGLRGDGEELFEFDPDEQVDAPFALARLDGRGRLDRSFGDGGRVLTDVGGSIGAFGLVVLGDGRLVAGGGIPAAMAFVRYLPDGRLDPSLGGTGRACVPFAIGQIAPVPAFTSARALYAQGDGRVVAGGGVALGDFEGFYLMTRLRRESGRMIECFALSEEPTPHYNPSLRWKGFVLRGLELRAQAVLARPTGIAIVVRRYACLETFPRAPGCLAHVRGPVGPLAGAFLGRHDAGPLQVTWDQRVGGRQLPVGDYVYSLVAVDPQGRLLWRTRTPMRQMTLVE